MVKTFKCLFLLLAFPYFSFALLSVSFVPTAAGTNNLVAKEENTGVLTLELNSLTNGTYSTIAGPVNINVSSNSLTDISILPVSTDNNQIASKLIIVVSDSSQTYLYIMDANLQNVSASPAATTSNTGLNASPMFVNNNSGEFLVLGINNNLLIYNLDLVNDTATLRPTPVFSDIGNILPLGENMLVVIDDEGGERVANIYSIVANQTIANFRSASLVVSGFTIVYDTAQFRTFLQSDLGDIDITDAPVPYGVVKINSNN